MKNYIIIIICILFFFSCKNHGKEDIIIKEYDSILDSVLLDIQIIKPKETIIPLLDSLTSIVDSCNMYKKSDLSFNVTSYQDSCWLKVNISPFNKKYFSYILKRQLFYYKGYTFSYNGIFLNTYFTKINSFIKYKVKDPKALQYNYDERGYIGGWEYVLINDSLKCISYGFCGNMWKDMNYEIIK